MPKIIIAIDDYSSCGRAILENWFQNNFRLADESILAFAQRNGSI